FCSFIFIRSFIQFIFSALIFQHLQLFFFYLCCFSPEICRIFVLMWLSRTSSFLLANNRRVLSNDTYSVNSH
ncbi:hypothetical protein L9F63_002595, partial [Diploptera punctata]